MPAHGSLLPLDKTGAAPEIEITIGQAQWGEYTIFLWDAENHHPLQIGAGLNDDNLPDSFRIADSAAVLHGRRLSWQIGIAAPKKGRGQRYSLRVRITQDGEPIEGGTIEDTGPLPGGSIFLRDYVQFQAR